jgi:DNA end-binding protein Ku
VSVPVEIFPAIKDQGIHFNWLHAKCGYGVRNRMLCPACNEVAEWADLVRGFEVAKGQYVQFTEEELDSLEVEANNSIDLKEFIPLAKVDSIFYESVITSVQVEVARRHIGC